jgi:SnoaL-like polyketide cyclase
MSSGDLALAAKAIHPEHINYMASDHPPAFALPGLPGFMATSAWLRFAFADLTFEVMDVVSDGHRTIAHVTMTGRQHRPFVVFPPQQSAVAFPPPASRSRRGNATSSPSETASTATTPQSATTSP